VFAGYRSGQRTPITLAPAREKGAKMSAPGITHSLSDQARITRETFFAGLGSVPMVLRETIEEGLTNRIERAGGRPLLGEYATSLLGDVIGIEDPRVPTRWAQPVMNVYVATLMTDDLLDRKDDVDSSLVSASSSLLVQRGITGLFRLLPAEPAADLIDRYFERAATAAVNELRDRRGRIQSYSPIEVSQLAEKGALLKLAAELMLIADGKTFDHATEALLDNLLVGVQLLDDLTDWREDWIASHSTYLLSLAFEDDEFQALHRAGQASSDDVFLSLLLTGAIEETLTLARMHLEQVMVGDPLRPGVAAYQLLDATIKHLRALALQVATIRSKLMANFEARLSFSDLSNQAQRDVRLVQERLLVVAQES
jgi:hypothetical protein